MNLGHLLKNADKDINDSNCIMKNLAILLKMILL